VKDDTGSYASVRVEGEDELVVVPVSFRKPEIPASVQEKWQKIVDLVAGIIHVPSGLITRLTEENLEIFAASRTPGNPYKRDDHDSLGIGMFCETVAGKRQPLLVADTSSSSYWAGNPHKGFGMRSYMGVPIQWEDGELFGTFCMLTDKANSVEASFLELMQQFKEIIETDLRYILLHDELTVRLSAKDIELREIHHRLKNQFNLLISYIDLQVLSAGEGATKETLREVQHRVLAVSMIHEELHNSAASEAPSLDIYLPRLCDHILSDLVDERIAIDYSIEEIFLPMEAEVSIAMILSELLTNTAKYAFPGAEGGRISIEAKKEADGAIALVYRDDGVGLPASFDPRKAGTLGMTIVNALAKQLNGSMKAQSEGGAKFSFRFKP
jgi:two-component sensor histidine kinase